MLYMFDNYFLPFVLDLAREAFYSSPASRITERHFRHSWRG